MTTPGSADQAIFDGMNGLSLNGQGLSYAEVAFLYDAHLLGLSKDYAFAEGANVSYSRLDAITTMAKILSRVHSHADGNAYDIWDAVQTVLKWVLKQDVHLNDDERWSVNFKPTPKTVVKERVRPTGTAAAPVAPWVWHPHGMPPQTGAPLPPASPWHGPCP